MTVTIRPYTKGGKKGWEADIMLTIPGRPKIRERRKAPVKTKSAAKRWAEARERQLIQHYTNPNTEDEDGKPDLATKEVPTLARFAPRYLEGYCEANRLRPSTIDRRKQAINTHLIPAFGRKRLDRITAEDLQRFKAERSHLRPTTVNQLLTILRCILNVAVDWKIIDALPVKVRKLKEGPGKLHFYDFEELDRLVLVAEKHRNTSRLVMVLLGAEAGLRCGEMRGLTWSDIDLERGTLTVSRTVWKNEEGPPKGGRVRTIPLAPRLRDALVRHRRAFRGPHVLWGRSGNRPTDTTIRAWLVAMQTELGFDQTGPHILRHTFCSHLAMLAEPPEAIRKLAGHASLSTTQRYTHLSPRAEREAIAALQRPSNWRDVGNASPKVVDLQ